MKKNKTVKKLGKVIEAAFAQCGAKIRIVGIQCVYNLKRYIFDIAITPGTKIKDILHRAEDVQVALGLPFFHVFKEGIKLRIAVSQFDLKENSLRKILKALRSKSIDVQIPYCLGYDMFGRMCVLDLTKIHHLLIAGPTGTGKSVALKSIVLSVITNCSVSLANLLILEVGGGSFDKFHNIPHLSHPIIKDISTAIRSLDALVKQMEYRFTRPENELHNLPYLICIVDEFISMINNVENKLQDWLINRINNLLDRGRKARIIMILTTNDPTLRSAKVDLSQITARISFAYTHQYKSKAALGITGAERLAGDGVMLYKSPKVEKVIQGAYASDREIISILDNPPTEYVDQNKYIIPISECSDSQVSVAEILSNKPTVKKDTKELASAVMWTISRDTVSALQIQRAFHIGKDKADAILADLCRLKIVEELFSKQPRKVLVKRVADLYPEAIEILKENGIPLTRSILSEDESESETEDWEC